MMGHGILVSKGEHLSFLCRQRAFSMMRSERGIQQQRSNPPTLKKSVWIIRRISPISHVIAGVFEIIVIIPSSWTLAYPELSSCMSCSGCSQDPLNFHLKDFVSSVPAKHHACPNTFEAGSTHQLSLSVSI